MKRLLFALLASVVWTATAHAAGIEYINIWASDLDYDAGFFYGCAPPNPQAPYHNGAVKNFYGSNISCNNLPPFASAHIDLPNYLQSPVVLTCTVYVQTANSDPSRQIGMQGAAAVSQPVSSGVPAVYDNNPGYVPGHLNNQISLTGSTVLGTTAYEVRALFMQFVVYDVTTGLQWQVPAGFPAPPARIYFQRDNTVNNNEAGDAQFIKAVCTAPTQ